MTNPKLAMLLREAVADNHKEKICLIITIKYEKKNIINDFGWLGNR